MDVLNPRLEEIDGAMYRINCVDYPADTGMNIEALPYVEADEFYEELECYNEKEFDDGEDELPNYEILPNKDSKFSFHVPKVLRTSIIGFKGNVRKHLQAETKTTIWIPKANEEGNIEVIARNKRSLQYAYHRMKTLINGSRLMHPFTHFLSLPINSSHIKDRFELFKKNVLETCSDERGVDEHLFQTPEKLHITIGTLTLLDERERKRAINLLQEYQKSFVDKSITVRVRGIAYMNDDPSEINVLYATVISTNNVLQNFVDKIANFFYQKGLMEKENERIKLHVTLMNTKFNSSSRVEIVDSTNRIRERFTFDASKIIKNFKNFDFGEIVVDSVHLSQRYTTSTEDGYFIASSKISF